MENLFLLFIPIVITLVIFLFRKKSKKQKNPQHEKSISKSLEAQPEIECDTPEALVKRATELKAKDINQAIKLIEKAIDLNPTIDYDQHFKLASYYHYSDKIEDAYKVYDKLINSLNIKDVSHYNLNKSQILERICTVNYKNEEYENYLFNYSFWLYNSLIAFACQGKSKEMKSILNNKNKLSNLAPSKVDGCFKKLKIENIRKYFNEQLNIYFSGLHDDLIFLNNGIKNSQKEIKHKSSKKISNENEADNFSGNEEFMKVFLKLNDDSFAQFYNINIKNYNIDLTNEQTTPLNLNSED